ncbi:hypothetical protein BJY59DRAFT_584649 [Rhodotorula toruloides]
MEVQGIACNGRIGADHLRSKDSLALSLSRCSRGLARCPALLVTGDWSCSLAAGRHELAKQPGYVASPRTVLLKTGRNPSPSPAPASHRRNSAFSPSKEEHASCVVTSRARARGRTWLVEKSKPGLVSSPSLACLVGWGADGIERRECRDIIESARSIGEQGLDYDLE